MEENVRPVIVLHCFMPNKIGGPMTGVRQLLESKLSERFEFRTVYQLRPAIGINLSLIMEMAREIRKSRPAILHVSGLQNEGFHGVVAGVFAGCPKIIVTVHGSTGEQLHISKVKRLLFKYIMEPLTLRLASCFYCVCHAMAEKMKVRRGFAGVIPNAAPIFKPTQSRDVVRRVLALEEKDVACIYVGRLTEEKGLSVFAEAMKNILSSEQAANLYFIFVGEGPMELSIAKRLSCYDNKVRFLGARTDVQDLLGASDLFVFPSLHENLSYSLLEACAAGLAVVATNVGGNPEVIRNGVDGVLVHPNDSKGLEQHILWLAKDRSARKRLGASARDRVNREFSQDKTWSQIGALYEKVLNGLKHE